MHRFSINFRQIFTILIVVTNLLVGSLVGIVQYYQGKHNVSQDEYFSMHHFIEDYRHMIRNILAGNKRDLSRFTDDSDYYLLLDLADYWKNLSAEEITQIRKDYYYE